MEVGWNGQIKFCYISQLSRLPGILKRNEQLIILASEHTFQICHALEEERKVHEHMKHLA